MRRLKKILFVFIVFLIIIFIFIINLVGKKDKNNNIENKENNKTEKENTKESVKRKKIIDAIYNKLNIYSYFDKSNLKSFEIIDLETYGYYESKDNILYIRVTYNIKCNDGTYSCNKLYNDTENNPLQDDLAFFIKIDTNTYDDIEMISGISADINSDWVQKYEYIK